MKNLKGISLFEILISSVIAIAIAAVIFTVLFTGERIFSSTSTSSQLHQNARQAIEWISKDVKWATQLLASRNINGYTYTSSGNELVFEVPSIDANGDVIDIDSTYDYIAFYLNANDPTILEKAVESNGAGRTSTTSAIANNISSVAFDWGADISSAKNITFTLTVSKNTGVKLLQETLSSIIKFRNK